MDLLYTYNNLICLLKRIGQHKHTLSHQHTHKKRKHGEGDAHTVPIALSALRWRSVDERSLYSVHPTNSSWVPRCYTLSWILVEGLVR